jgi:putative methionine-R-sulfoxide reductase with GAF domain
VTNQDKKPGLDEQTFGKLLEAAYVLQEHNREVREMEESLEMHSEQLRQQESANQEQFPRRSHESEETRPNSDYTLTLAEIVEAQHQIQIRHLELDQAMAVVAERVARITNASGAAIGLLEGKMVRYRAGAGSPALPPGSDIPLERAIGAASVRTGQVIRSEDVSTEFLFDSEECRQRGIQSLVAVPIYHDGCSVGALELYFDRIHGFVEQDIHTCQLMAGLVTEAIGRNSESALKKSMASERSTMIAAIERLKPNLAALAEDQPSGNTSKKAVASAAGLVCWKCGDKLVTEEQFCGTCGAPRASENEPSRMQGELASEWYSERANRETSVSAPRNGGLAESTRLAGGRSDVTEFEGEEAGDHAHKLFSLPGWGESGLMQAQPLVINANEDTLSPVSPESELSQDDIEATATALVRSQQDGAWGSAARAREFLEALTATGTPNAFARFWQSRRGSFYLAIAVILVLVVIRWGILSGDRSVSATNGGTAVSGGARRHKQPAPDADLSTFDKLLIDLGLAEAPEVPEYKGNPATQVWVDLHTALYYCPGSDLYGKTQKGKFASQRDAQLDQFEPASRKACE